MNKEEKIIPVNVDEIMAKKRENIKEHGYQKEQLRFADIAERKRTEQLMEADENQLKVLQNLVNEVNARKEIVYAAYPAEKSIKGLIKYVIRRCVSFLIVPVIVQINHLNCAISDSLNQIYSCIDHGNQAMVVPVHGQMKVMDMQSVIHPYMESQERIMEDIQTRLAVLELQMERMNNLSEN